MQHDEQDLIWSRVEYLILFTGVTVLDEIITMKNSNSQSNHL